MGTGLPERHAFLVEWLDPKSGIIWKYQLIYHVDTKEVEMIDIKNRKTFLKKCKYEGVTPAMLFLGNTITVYARQLKIVDYADDYTRSKLSSRQERTLAMVKPDAVQHLGKVVEAISHAGFVISNMKMCKLSKTEAQQFYAVHQGKPFYERLTDFMSSGRVVAMEVVGEGAIKGWRELIGPTDSNRAREQAPQSLRAQFGSDGTQNACHGSDAPDTAAAELGFFFGQQVGRCDLGRNTTLCLIKPHAVKAGYAGPILDRIQQVFSITALQMFNLDAANAGEFYEVYRGVVPAGEYSGMVDELTSGPFIAIEVADRDGADPVEAFRELCGPADPEIAKVLRPESLRASFGISKVKNGVHCTDLPEDGELETSYFFSILQQ
ncbi:hypothetical protein WJX72_009041 [[Myrmecia] bisecta]|uniref:Nucleoside diphosphate kinase n=1 Tax=[Myrmecia] bisecta TaxID=41462 RepID=A0AAW1PKM8_9CHLO